METDNAVGREKLAPRTTSKKKNVFSFFTNKISDNFEEEILHWLQGNIPVVAAILGVLVLGAAAYGGWSYYHDSRQKAEAKLAYDFRETSLTAFTQKKLSATDLLRAYADFKNQTREVSVYVPQALAVQKELAAQGLFKEAKDVLAPIEEKVKNNSLYAYLVHSQLAALSEDLGQPQEAIDYLERMLKSPNKFLEAKIYLDLGRNYLKLGNKEKAKLNLEYVVQNFFNDDLAKVAKLYLSQLDKS